MNKNPTPFEIFLEKQKTLRLKNQTRVQYVLGNNYTHFQTTLAEKRTNSQSQQKRRNRLFTNFNQEGISKREQTSQENNRDYTLEDGFFGISKALPKSPYNTLNSHRVSRTHRLSHKSKELNLQFNSNPELYNKTRAFTPVLQKKYNNLLRLMNTPKEKKRLLLIKNIPSKLVSNTNQEKKKNRKSIEGEIDSEYYKLTDIYQRKCSPKEIRIKQLAPTYNSNRKKQSFDINLQKLSMETIEPWESQIEEAV